MSDNCVNILIVIADRLSRQAIGAYGSSLGVTPNIDRLAARGARFDACYTPSPLCQPARAAFWMGRFPHETGIRSNGWKDSVPTLAADVPTLGEIFSAAGYDLDAAGLPVPAELTGRSLLGLIESPAFGQVDAGRDHVLVGSECHGPDFYPCRVIATGDNLCIRNFRPGQVTLAAGGAGPAEELYDNRKDPDQMTNVASDPKYVSAREGMARRLTDELQKTGDPRELGHGEVFENYPNRSPKFKSG